jgi:hypothetical protein
MALRDGSIRTLRILLLGVTLVQILYWCFFLLNFTPLRLDEIGVLCLFSVIGAIVSNGIILQIKRMPREAQVIGAFVNLLVIFAMHLEGARWDSEWCGLIYLPLYFFAYPSAALAVTLVILLWKGEPVPEEQSRVAAL